MAQPKRRFNSEACREPEPTGPWIIKQSVVHLAGAMPAHVKISASADEAHPMMLDSTGAPTPAVDADACPLQKLQASMSNKPVPEGRERFETARRGTVCVSSHA